MNSLSQCVKPLKQSVHIFVLNFQPLVMANESLSYHSYFPLNPSNDVSIFKTVFWEIRKWYYHIICVGYSHNSTWISWSHGNYHQRFRHIARKVNLYQVKTKSTIRSIDSSYVLHVKEYIIGIAEIRPCIGRIHCYETVFPSACSQYIFPSEMSVYECLKDAFNYYPGEKRK